VKRTKKVFFIYFGLFLLGLFFFIKFRNWRLEKDGIFTLGTIEEITSSKSGQIFSVRYFFKGQSYATSFSGVGLSLYKGKFIFIRLSNNHPGTINILDYLNEEVPSCITLKNLPFDGWKEVPRNICK